ncbi:MAG: hypothetical protein CME64_12515 [Halobacteriovoraceae bacterium]|nr:hypothetical protein [Halobacteriovoraceae bacterium]
MAQLSECSRLFFLALLLLGFSGCSKRAKGVAELSQSGDPGNTSTRVGQNRFNHNLDKADLVHVRGNHLYAGSKLIKLIDVTTPSSPQTLSTITFQSQVKAIVEQNGQALFISGTGLYIYDVSNFSNPVLVGSLDLWAVTPIKMTADGTTAYIAADDSGVLIVDISNPAAPTLLSSFDTVGRAKDIAFYNGHLLIADFGNGLVVLDVSNPSTPGLVTTYASTVGYVYGLSLNGDVLVLDGESEFEFVDIATPGTPATIADLDLDYQYLDRVSVASDDVLYVSAEERGVFLYDISDPVNPVHLGSYNTNGSVQDLSYENNYLYVADGSGVSVLDVADKQSVLALSKASLPTTNPEYSVKSGNFLYVATRNDFLHVFDVSTSTNPVLRGSLDLGGRPTFLEFYNGYVFVTRWTVDDLLIIDVSDPDNPVQASQITGRFEIRGASQILDDHLYTISSDTNPTTLDIYDISSPLSPSLISSTSMTQPGYSTHQEIGVKVKGNYAYIGKERDPVVVYDISDKSNPVLVPTTRKSYMKSDAWRMWQRGDHLFFREDSDGLTIVNIANPSSPHLVNNIENWWGDFYDVELSGTMLTTISNRQGIEFWDFSNDKVIKSLGGFNHLTDGSYGTIFIDGNTAYVTSSSELHILDISDKESVVEVAYIQEGFADYVEGTVYKNGYYYVVNDFGNLHIWDVSNGLGGEFIKSMKTSNNSTYSIGKGPGDTLLLETEAGGIVLDVSNPTNPVEVTRGFRLFSCDENSGQEGSTYYCFSYGGLHLYDVTNPSSPTIISTQKEYGVKGGAHINGDAFAYKNDGIYYIDTSDLNLLTYTKVYSPPTETRDIATKDGFLYVFNNSDGFEILDVSSPLSASTVFTYSGSSGEKFRYSTIIDDVMITPTNDGSISIFDVGNASTPALIEKQSVENSFQTISNHEGSLYLRDSEGFSPIQVRPDKTVDFGW